MLKLLKNVDVEVGLNKKVPYLEGKTIFGSTKQNLDLPLGDDSDSHHHDQLNYSVSKLGKRVSSSQVQVLQRSSTSAVQGLSFGKSSNPSGVSQKFD